MKKVISIMAILIAAVTSVIIAQHLVRTFYNRWSRNRYTETGWSRERAPWE